MFGIFIVASFSVGAFVWCVAWHRHEISWRDRARQSIAAELRDANEELRDANARIDELEALVVPKDEEDEDEDEPKPNVFAVDDLVTVYLTVDTRVVGKICGATDDELIVQVGIARIKAHPDDVEHHDTPGPGYRDNAKGA